MNAGRYLSIKSFDHLSNYCYYESHCEDLVTNVIFKNETWLKQFLLPQIHLYIKQHKLNKVQEKTMIKALTYDIFDNNTFFVLRQNFYGTNLFYCDVSTDCVIVFKHTPDINVQEINVWFKNNGKPDFSATFTIEGIRKITFYKQQF